MKLYWILFLNIFLMLKIIIAQNRIYDFCNINESKTVYSIIKELTEYYTNSNKLDLNEKCFLFNGSLTNYYERFNHIDNINKNNYANFQCTECNKKFKKKDLLYLHFKIFHLKDFNYYCPS